MSTASYWDIVKGQFAKHRGSVWAMRALLAIVLLATYAPALAHNAPFFTGLDDAPFSPWLASLLDPTVFPQAVDLFFNLLMGTLPFAVAAWYLARGRRRALVLAGWGIAHLAIFFFVDARREEMRSPPVNWSARVREADASALFPPIRHHPEERRSEFVLTPVWSEGKLAPGAPAPEQKPFYVLGSDNLGNDVLTRLLYGTRISLTIGVLAVAIYVVIGVALGGVAGYFGGWLDDFLMFVAQVVMTLPALFLIMFFLSVLEKPSIYHTMLIIALLNWPTVMRLVRGEFLRQREIDYVAAARALGVSDSRIIFRHITPNTLAPVLVNATFGVALCILLESTLAFLGLGDANAPSWGQLLKVGHESAGDGRHLIWTAGLAIFGMVLLLNVVGEGLRDALDPKLRR
mgnify:FL=1